MRTCTLLIAGAVAQGQHCGVVHALRAEGHAVHDLAGDARLRGPQHALLDSLLVVDLPVGVWASQGVGASRDQPGGLGQSGSWGVRELGSCAVPARAVGSYSPVDE